MSTSQTPTTTTPPGQTAPTPPLFWSQILTIPGSSLRAIPPNASMNIIANSHPTITFVVPPNAVQNLLRAVVDFEVSEAGRNATGPAVVRIPAVNAEIFVFDGQTRMFPPGGVNPTALSAPTSTPGLQVPVPSVPVPLPVTALAPVPLPAQSSTSSESASSALEVYNVIPEADELMAAAELRSTNATASLGRPPAPPLSTPPVTPTDSAVVPTVVSPPPIIPAIPVPPVTPQPQQTMRHQFHIIPTPTTTAPTVPPVPAQPQAPVIRHQFHVVQNPLNPTATATAARTAPTPTPTTYNISFPPPDLSGLLPLVAQPCSIDVPDTSTGDELSEYVCCICMDYFDKPSGTNKCNDRFCLECLKTWVHKQVVAAGVNANGNPNPNPIAAGGGGSCPSCRAPMDASDIIEDSLLLQKMKTSNQIACPNPGCDEKFNITVAKEHGVQCMYAMVKCQYTVYGCVFRGTRHSLLAHLESSCKIAAVGGLVQKFREADYVKDVRLGVLEGNVRNLAMAVQHNQQVINFMGSRAGLVNGGVGGGVLGMRGKREVGRIWNWFEFLYILTCTPVALLPPLAPTRSEWSLFLTPSPHQKTPTFYINCMTCLPFALLIGKIGVQGLKALLNVPLTMEYRSVEDNVMGTSVVNYMLDFIIGSSLILYFGIAALTGLLYANSYASHLVSYTIPPNALTLKSKTSINIYDVIGRISATICMLTVTRLPYPPGSGPGAEFSDIKAISVLLALFYTTVFYMVVVNRILCGVCSAGGIGSSSSTTTITPSSTTANGNSTTTTTTTTTTTSVGTNTPTTNTNTNTNTDSDTKNDSTNRIIDALSYAIRISITLYTSNSTVHTLLSINVLLLITEFTKRFLNVDLNIIPLDSHFVAGLYVDSDLVGAAIVGVRVIVTLYYLDYKFLLCLLLLASLNLLFYYATKLGDYIGSRMAMRHNDVVTGSLRRMLFWERIGKVLIIEYGFGILILMLGV